jgi:hypothetical protein
MARLGLRGHLVVLGLPLVEGLVHVLGCLLEVLERIFLQYFVCLKVHVIRLWLRFRVFLVEKLIIFDAKDVLDETQVDPRVVEHGVNVSIPVQNDQQGPLLLLGPTKFFCSFFWCVAEKLVQLLAHFD